MVDLEVTMNCRFATVSRQLQALLQQSRNSTQILQLHGFLLKISLDHHEYFFSQLMISAASVSLQLARKLFDNSAINPPPAFAWNTLIRVYSNNSTTPLESIKLFAELLRTSSEVKPDKFTYPFVIKACGRCSMLGVGGSLHSMVLKAGFGLDSHVNNTLLSMYGACGVFVFSRRVFDEMRERDVVSWSSMVAAYVDCHHDLDALRVFNDMMLANEKPNSVTVVSLLAACSNLLNIRLGKSIHTFILVNGMELHVGLGTALLTMYAGSGHLKECFHIFNSISEKNLQCWTVMIACLADNGLGEEAVSLFTRMKQTGFRPDGVSFSAILSACSHKGLLAEGQELFEEMVNEYNIKPTVEHYGCMVDLYARAGRIDEAYQIIMSMPMEPNSIILRSYLCALKHHGHVPFADKHLMQLLLKIEPNIGANYVLAATVTPSDGCWNGIGNIRNGMKVKGLKKVPGRSWVLCPGGDQMVSCEEVTG